MRHSPQKLPWQAASMALLLLLVGVRAQAQEPPTARLTAQQAKALDRAVEQARDGALEEALATYDGLLAELDMNLLHLNRGRVLQKLNRCEEARATFDRVLAAPRDPNIELAVIRKTLDRYNKGLEATCPGWVTVTCAQRGMTLSIDGDGPRPCDGEPVRLDAGPATIVGAFQGQQVTGAVEIKGTRRVSLSLGLAPAMLVAAGRVLLAERRFEAALEVLEEALRSEADSAALLYIGEALIGQRRCQTAFVALEETRGAPPSASLSPVEFERRLEDLHKVFVERCGERVLIACKPAALTLRIDGGAPRVCSPAPIFLGVGKHTLTASVPGQAEAPGPGLTRELTVEAGQLNRVDINLEEDDLLGPMGAWGFAVAGLGVASLGTALTLDRAVLAPELSDFRASNNQFRDAAAQEASLDRIDALQTTNKILLVSGSALILTGGVLVGLDLFLNTDDEAPDASISLQPTLGLRGAEVLWRTQW